MNFRPMRHFKLPLIVTGVVVALALVFGLAAVTWIHQSKLSDRKKLARAQMLGAGTAVTTCLVIVPFWLFAAAKVGKERRARKAAADQAGTDAEG